MVFYGNENKGTYKGTSGPLDFVLAVTLQVLNGFEWNKFVVVLIRV